MKRGMLKFVMVNLIGKRVRYNCSISQVSRVGIVVQKTDDKIYKVRIIGEPDNSVGKFRYIGEGQIVKILDK